MDPGQILSGIIITLITSLVAWLSQRASTKASITNVTTSGRVEMEKEAYERARKLDTETINRQESELDDLRERNEKLEQRVEVLQDQNRKLNEDVARISRDNYDLHVENRTVIETNERILVDNERLRLELAELRQRVTRIQRGIPSQSTEPVRERITDTNPMRPEVEIGGE